MAFRGSISGLDPLGGEPPTWILFLSVLFFATTGAVFLMLARRWANRRRRGVEPPPKTFWSMSYTVPHHPEDGYLLGFFLLGLATLALAGLAARVLHLW